MIAQLTFAFVAGTVATANPCGFALLPGYLARLLGQDDGSATSRTLAISRALAVGGATTVGFLLVFATVGGGISLGARWLIDAMPWIGLIVGVLLVTVGIATLAGAHIGVRSPLVRAPKRSGYSGALLFGIAYGACSLACTLPIFLMAVGSSLTGTTLGAGLAFVAYALGMGSILTALAVAVALARGGLAATIRRVLPHLARVTGMLLVLVGVYVVYYWTFALVGAKTGTAWSRPLDLASRASSYLEAWLSGTTGRTAVAWIVAGLAATVAWTLWWRLSARFARRSGDEAVVPSYDDGAIGQPPDEAVGHSRVQPPKAGARSAASARLPD